MKCIHCNSEVAEGVQFCPNCGNPMYSKQQPHQGQYQQYHANGNSYSPAKPDNNMIWGILCTVLCCIPFGVYSIILASKVNGLYNSGYYDEAQKKADEAKKWAIIGAAVGLVSIILYALAAA